MSGSVQIEFEEIAFDPRYLDALERIEKEAGDAQWSRYQLQVLSEHLTMDTRLIISPDSFDQPIGFYTVEHGDAILYISNIAVASEWRRCGVGLFALSAAEKLGRQLGYRKMALDVQEENLAAQLLYRKAGFKVAAINHGHYQNQDGYYMEKPITK